MKNIQKELPLLIGLIATTSLAVVSGGLVNSTLTNIGASFAANILNRFNPHKFLQLI